MYEITLLEKLIIYIPPVLFAIIFHEIAHGWVASCLGDQTARSLGRLSPNPIKHIDPVGTVLIPALMYYFTPYIFGWAKPVPVNWMRLGHPRRDMALVAIAGPAANLGMLVCWTIVAKLLIVIFHEHGHVLLLLIAMCSIGILANVLLMILNLFPLLPLDGGRIFTARLPGKFAVLFFSSIAHFIYVTLFNSFFNF